MRKTGVKMWGSDQKIAEKPAAVVYLETAISYTYLEFEITFFMM